ncbi:LysE family translocator [Bizionia gelidisalsuginis]|uniref:LysE family translocator n=1 Tax=Bizionia gelidisalsuginis TaxID=291188 RepID=A0ABY3MDJ3_9FLAO|nr:LysE family translocator [Bizionia gelidisalsuginis]TYC17073.1 LysE family translocator [Bizionia gelidisalsuginis]
MGIENFMTFIITALFFVMTPGIDTIFVLNKSIGQGKKAGVYSTLGINTGILVHTLFAALGLSIIVAKSAMAFSIIKYIGAAYLIILGISSLFSKKGMVKTVAADQKMNTGRENFISGLITNTLNPKVALFFLAFFPQFISPAQLESALPFIILGVTFAIIGIAWYLILTFFAGTFSKKIMQNPKADYWMNKCTGIIFILMGLKIALTKK